MKKTIKLLSVLLLTSGMAAAQDTPAKLVADGMQSVTHNGILGDSREANAARGIRDNMRWVDYCCEYILERLNVG